MRFKEFFYKEFILENNGSYDDEYLKLAQEPDDHINELQRMVEKAARVRGYDVRAFHQTDADFTVFDLSRTDSASGGNTTFRRKAAFFTIDGPKIRKIMAMLKDKGYNGASYGTIEMNVFLKLNPETDYIRNRAEDGTEVAITDPTRIKSSDPITYDDTGKIIPLSQRFDSSKDDIRY